MTVAAVNLWDGLIGAVSQEDSSSPAVFQYDSDFARSGVQLSPLTMPLRRAPPYSFPALRFDSFRGLPGLLADSLPDDFGSAVIDAWLARQGRTPESFSAVERLCDIGTRGMGALEFEPVSGPAPNTDIDVQVSELVKLASEVLAQREGSIRRFCMRERTPSAASCWSAPPRAERARRRSSPTTRPPARSAPARRRPRTGSSIGSSSSTASTAIARSAPRGATGPLSTRIR